MRISLHTRSLFLDAESADGHARFLITGEYDPHDMESMIPVMLAQTVELGFERAFIDITGMTGELPDFDRYSLAETFVRHWGTKRRAAVRVDPTRQRVNKLFENVAVNRSGQVRVGDRPEELIAWLMGE